MEEHWPMTPTPAPYSSDRQTAALAVSSGLCFDGIASLCRAYRVSELSLFGSVLRPDFRPDSDVDLLVEFETDAPIGLLEYCALQNKLADLIHRRVDLVSKRGLKPLIRDSVLAEARVIYAR
jgi:hypothetical protein